MWSLLQQPLLDDTAFAVYGWIMLYDWVQGRREVLSVEGDAASIVLISTSYDAQEIPTSGDTRFVKNASQIAIYTTAYASTVLALVALLCVVHSVRLRFRILGRNLFQFNRVVMSGDLSCFSAA
ncbi:hypothetical protein SPRG_16834 [Saprolegnia parasitica CBS 223.65]|uniref:Uncharacterized protein n=1 Tax=Saprolegnia parasitica (strain CBS 223.65) TaxID=695850 RepID=A0A067BHW0_SAPPC|nr:hypothetical protein SPRG_16834 [Saprolegnia parasitica CBS 223.65]KDO17723.1 hypothetical protein SPRG_16834 [Saprolegnia parasitica CBS 223.65]|eukprot:XP_012211566.1 hypothetical protein SPRG_16834 [Saprolegnia parasitica CBS 223.65]